MKNINKQEFEKNALEYISVNYRTQNVEDETNFKMNIAIEKEYFNYLKLSDIPEMKRYLLILIAILNKHNDEGYNYKILNFNDKIWITFSVNMENNQINDNEYQEPSPLVIHNLMKYLNDTYNLLNENNLNRYSDDEINAYFEYFIKRNAFSDIKDFESMKKMLNNLNTFHIGYKSLNYDSKFYELTVQQLENMTNELNNATEDNYKKILQKYDDNIITKDEKLSQLKHCAICNLNDIILNK